MNLKCLLCSAIFLTACSSTGGNKVTNVTKNIYNISDYNYPRPSQENSSYQTIVLLGTNDIHGTLLPSEGKTKSTENAPSVTFRYAGVSFLNSYVTALRTEWKDNFIWLDAGDEFQGSLESNSFQGAPMVDFFNHSKLDAAAVGNHEFDFGIQNLEKRFNRAKYPYVATNVSKINNEKTVPLYGAHKSVILNTNGIQVGVIGLSTLETPFTTATNLKKYRFEDLAQATIRESKALKKRGAQIVVVVAHVGAECGVEKNSTKFKAALYREQDPQPACQSGSELVAYLNKLPQGTIDAVVSGHTHTIIHHWIAGVPVVQSEAYGKYFSVVYLTFDKKKNKIVPEKTVLEGPVPICEKVFSNQGNCNGTQNVTNEDRDELVPFTYHGTLIQEDTRVNQLLKPYVDKTEKLKAQKITFVANPVTKSYSSESSFGNLVTDALAKKTHADVAIFNAGGIRTNWKEGVLTYGDVFQAFPFDNQVVTAQLSGADLVTLMKTIQAGKKGFYPTSGLKQVVTLNPRNLVSITLINGSQIDPSKTYRIVTNDFLLGGGDDFAQALKAVRFKNVKRAYFVRDVVLEYLKQFQSINTTDHPLIDMQKPRLFVE